MERCGAVLPDQQHDRLDNHNNHDGTSSNEPVSESDLEGIIFLRASYSSFKTTLKNVVYVTLTL
jgi:hypothetical protein